ncbi:SSL2 DNA or RNA helicases of superfamily II, partial [uncultured Caudovirales phage]
LSKCKDKGTKAAMVMDRRVLVHQTSQRLKKYGLDHGIIMNGEPFQSDKLIQICSEQTLSSRGGLNDIDIIILDEAHIFRKSTIDLINSKPSIKVVGLTATPFTKGLGNIYSSVVSEITTSDLVRDKKLVLPKFFALTQIDTNGLKKVAGEYDEGQLQERAILINCDIVKEWAEKTFEFFGKPEKTIVFSSGVEHSQQLKQSFIDAGYAFETISYLDKEDVKNGIITEFMKPDSKITGIISTDILTKGFDCADIKLAISARPFAKSFSSHVQQLGRLMRSHPEKDIALWLCHSGNLLKFKKKWIPLYYEGVQNLDNEDEDGNGEAPLKECPACSAEIPLSCKICPECGHEFQPEPKEIEVVDGVLDEVDMTTLITTTQQKIFSIKFMPHHSKAGHDGFKAIINGKYTKYFATHTKRGLAEYEKARQLTPNEILVQTGGTYPDIKLIW